ncbi:UNVERIFIED_CONTAM: hypothetical protein NCL1_41351 [Trichonephila clavipes]
MNKIAIETSDMPVYATDPMISVILAHHNIIDIRDYGLCGVTASSPLGCSYAIYLIICLILPPLSVIIINGLLLSARICKRSRTIVVPKRNISSGNSHILSADKEVMSLVIFMSLVIILSLPRSMLDAGVMCENVKYLQPGTTFSAYFLDSLLNILLPVICLGLHPNARLLLWQTLVRSNSVSSDIDLVELNKITYKPRYWQKELGIRDYFINDKFNTRNITFHDYSKNNL